MPRLQWLVVASIGEGGGLPDEDVLWELLGDGLAGLDPGSAATSLPPLHLLLANFAISDQRIHACLRQPLPCAVHAKAEGLGLNSIFATMPLVIVGASLPYRLAIGMLRRSDPSGKREYKNGHKQGAAHLHHHLGRSKSDK